MKTADEFKKNPLDWFHHNGETIYDTVKYNYIRYGKVNSTHAFNMVSAF